MWRLSSIRAVTAIVLGAGLGAGLGISEAPSAHPRAGRTSTPPTAQQPPRTTAPVAASPATTAPPSTPWIEPLRPGPLAIAPDGGLYISDYAANEVFELLPDGSFRIIAGNGKGGYSGDGGPATAAELNGPYGIAVAKDGTLYVADDGNSRVRAVSPNGVITTVAGNGQPGTWVADGTPAQDAALAGALAVTIAPTGLLYIAVSNEVLRLNPDGTLTHVLGSSNAGVFGPGPAADRDADGADGLAFDAEGNLYVSGFDDKSLLMVDAQGNLSFPVGRQNFYARYPGCLASAPDGMALGCDSLSLVRLSPTGVETLYDFGNQPFLGIRYFEPDGIAVAPDGTIYLDTFTGNGYANQTAIVAISPSGTSRVLWST